MLNSRERVGASPVCSGDLGLEDVLQCVKVVSGHPAIPVELFIGQLDQPNGENHLGSLRWFSREAPDVLRVGGNDATEVTALHVRKRSHTRLLRPHFWPKRW